MRLKGVSVVGNQHWIYIWLLKRYIRGWISTGNWGLILFSESICRRHRFTFYKEDYGYFCIKSVKIRGYRGPWGYGIEVYVEIFGEDSVKYLSNKWKKYFK